MMDSLKLRHAALVLPCLLAFAGCTSAASASEDTVTASSGRVTISTGTQSDGTPWTLTAYESNDGLCLEVGYNGNQNPGGGCDWSLSSSKPASFAQDMDGDRNESMIFGPVLAAVDQVKIKLEGDTQPSISVAPKIPNAASVATLGRDQSLKFFATSVSGARRVQELDAYADGHLLYTRTADVSATWPPPDGPIPPPVPPDVKSLTHGTFAGSCSVNADGGVTDLHSPPLSADYGITGSATCNGTLDGQQLLDGNATLSLSGEINCIYNDDDYPFYGTLRFDELTPGDPSDDTLVDVKADVYEGSAMSLTGLQSGRATYEGTTSGDAWNCQSSDTKMKGTLQTIVLEPLVG